MAPPQTAEASSSQPALTASQYRRVMLCIQANWMVPASSSPATSGAPQNSPKRTGAPRVAMTRKPTTWLPMNSPLPRMQPWPAAQAAALAWSRAAICRPVITITTANAASKAAAT